MDLVTQWLWCLAAFVLGALVALAVAAAVVRARSVDEALADLPDAREVGGRR
ncbi:hypothetical protein [Ornithinimicrobium tianjinense]|uniref:Uncharacterized protein n=1 Tax=Ornithinimicrobium tianjinense TaxID=1195761 RepID=A0A917F9F6_9MICO|nr:hypothetical protein [Ornithinimicrobium tianjinense]GGF55401.1 hypothetical protein GCM10011366_24150 [Ornithinimicrobium tianjinense]